MPWTGATMNMCIFGAVALGPVIGGIQAGAKDWRPLFWIVAGIAGLALLFVLLTFEDQEPQDRDAPWDWVAQTLAGLGCAAAFFGASELTTHRLTSAVVLIPLVAGLVLIVALVAYEYLIERPLMPIRSIATTFPVAGIVVAVGSGLLGVGVGASVSPALFQAGFSLQSAQLPRVFALIELLRGVSAFMIGPILLHVAQTVGGNPASGTRTALWISFAIAAGGALVAVTLFVIGRARL